MKKFMAFLIGVALVSIVLTGVIPAEADGDNTKNVDVAIVLDNSGSMAGEKWDNATESAKGFISKLKSGDRCCIFCFEDLYPSHDKPMMIMGFTSINDAGIQSLNSAIDSLDPECYTPLFDTIGAAMDYVVNNKRTDSVGAIVALTDGIDNVCYEFYPSHDYREEEIVDPALYSYSGDWGSPNTRFGLLSCSQATFIIGLDIESASSTYREQLQNIAESSSGAYYSAAEGAELGAIYDQIAEKIEEKRSEGGELPWLWILIIVIVVAVVAIIAILLLRRKKVPMGSAPGPQQQPPQQTQNQEGRQTSPPPNVPTCPMCGGQLRFIPQYNRYWCDGCQKYK